MLVVFPQGKSLDQLGAHLRAADASLVGSSNIPGGFIVSSRTSGLPERLKQQGALFVLNSSPNLGCIPAIQNAAERGSQPAS